MFRLNLVFSVFLLLITPTTSAKTNPGVWGSWTFLPIQLLVRKAISRRRCSIPKQMKLAQQ